jgi:hypothetical protein
MTTGKGAKSQKTAPETVKTDTITLKPKEGGKEVELSSLGTTELFKYQGSTYSKRKVTPAGVKALFSKGDKLITLPPDTLVTKV